jgi:arylsulfatase A-like enzyme
MGVSRRDFVKTTGMATAAGLWLAASAAAQQKPERAAAGAATAPGASGERPMNILFLMCDQYRPDALGRFGDRYAITPTLDALAASGISFRQAYCQNPVCVPARNAILMGRYCHSMGVLHNGYVSDRNFATIPQHLRSKGYVTGCFGKLHVKGRKDLDWNRLREGVLKEPSETAAGGGAVLSSGFSGNQPLGAPDPAPMEETFEWKAKEEAIRYMKANRDRPWFIQYSCKKPHTPFQPPKRYWDAIDRTKLEIPRYPDDDLDDVHPRLWDSMVRKNLDKITDGQILDAMQGYYGNIAFCDAMFGEVLAALDALGLRDRTLIVFTADHGEMLYDHRLWTKYAFFDASVRIPLILSLAGAIPAGRETRALVEHVDLFPTLMDLAGFETPPSSQGRSFAAVAKGASDRHRDVVRSEHYFKGDSGLAPTLMEFDGRLKTIDNGPNCPPELYDLETDPREIASLAQEPKHRDRVERTVAGLRQWVKQDAVPPNRRLKGGDAPRPGDDD